MVATVIYLLIDPRDSSVRYVGKTTQSIPARITAHFRDKAKCHRVHWLNELKAAGLRPDYLIVEEVEGEWPWQESERFWIRYLKSLGANLTNNTSGGDGVCNLPIETKERMRRTWLGRKHKPETIAKLKLSRPNFRHTEETKLKMGQTHKGRKITWKAKIAESIRKFTPEVQAQIVARLKAGEKVKNLATEFGAHRTTISKIGLGTYNLPYRKRESSASATARTMSSITVTPAR